MCALLISDHHQQIENVKHKASIGKHFVFTLFFFFSIMFDPSFCHCRTSPKGFLVVHIGTVDQKKKKYKMKTTK